MWLFEKQDDKEWEDRLAKASLPPAAKEVGSQPTAITQDGRPPRPWWGNLRHHRNKELRRMRAHTILAMRLQGYSLRNIARVLHTSERTVKTEVDWAKREGLYEEIRQQALELGKTAISVYKKNLAKSLESGDIEAARDVLHGLGVLSKNGIAPIAPVNAALQEGIVATLEEYRIKRLAVKEAPPATEVTEVTDAESEVVEAQAETVEVPEGLGTGPSAVATGPGRTRAIMPPPQGEYPSGS